MQTVFEKLTPRIILYIYVIVIIAFSFIYTANSKHFYHSTIQKESKFLEYQVKFTKAVEELIISEMIEINESIECDDRLIFNIDSVNAWLSEFTAKSLRSGGSLNENRLASLVVSYEAYRASEEERSEDDNFRATKFHIDMQRREPSLGGDYRIWLRFPIQEPVLTQKLSCAALSDLKAVAMGGNGDIGYLVFEPEVNEVGTNIIRGYAKLLNGNPSTIDTYLEGLSRMLYLSLVTITTLGYGDIVPTHLITRLLVGLEAFLGVVIIGVFLWSLTNRIAK